MADLFQIKNRRKLAATLDFNIFGLSAEEKFCREDGFSLVEAVVALVILLIVVSGVFVTFTYAVNYNAGNNTRAQALAVLQQEVELMRSAKFTPAKTDNYPIVTPDDGRRDITGGVKTARIVTAANGNSFKVQTTVDDDPFTAGVQVDSTKTIKEITVTVTLNNPTPGWQTAVPATIVLRRVQAN